MHELSVALSIVDLAEEEQERHGGRIATVHLRIGPLSGVVKDALASAFELAREGTPLAGADLVIEDVPLVARCPACGEDRTPRFPMLVCPVCGGPTPDVVRGRELDVFALEFEP
jgi:hydrogenase nickel incorporation protein HypA/HybF